MKKLFTITMVLLAYTVSAQNTTFGTQAGFISATNDADTISAQNITFGVKAGLNFVPNGARGLGGRSSFHIGATAEIEISDSFSIQPELLYSRQGFNADDDVKGRLGNINLPVIAKFYVVKDFSLELGPQISFLAHANSDNDGESTDIKDYLKSTNFGLNLGVGYKLDSGLNFGLRYLRGIRRTYGFKQNLLQLSVGYNF